MLELACKGNADRDARQFEKDRRTLAIPASAPAACDIARVQYPARRDDGKCLACGRVVRVRADGHELERGGDRLIRKGLWRFASARNRRREIAEPLHEFRAQRLR